MLDSVSRKSGLFGVMIGGGMAGGLLLVGVSPIVAGAIAVIWSITGTITLFTDQMYEDEPYEPSKWVALFAGTTGVSILAVVPILDSGNSGVLNVIMIGLAVTSYHAGIATVHTRQTVSTETAKQAPDSD